MPNIFILLAKVLVVVNSKVKRKEFLSYHIVRLFFLLHLSCGFFKMVVSNLSSNFSGFSLNLVNVV